MIPLFLLALLGCPKSGSDNSPLEAQLEGEIRAMRETMRTLEVEAKTCQQGGTSNPLYAELRQVIPTDTATVEARGPVTMITFPESHLFGSDDISIRDEATAALDLLATALQLHNDYTVIIEGHTADVQVSPVLSKRWPDLRDLSYARAHAVRDVLVDRFGVPDEQLSLSARGPFAPIQSNDTTAGQTQNRRVVILIYPPGMR